MPDGDRLPSTGAVLRLPTVNQTFVVAHASGAQRRPLPDAFALSPREREALSAGRRVLVSVWDRAKITAEGARALRNSRAEVAVFSLPVAKVEAIARELEHPELRVVEDRAGAPEGVPGEVREAHAGIGGLDADPPGHPNRKLRKDARTGLALACVAAD